MVFGQTNTGFQVGIGRAPFSTGLNTGFSTPSVTNTSNSTKKTTTKKKDSTYNSRYPGFNEEEYKKLEKMVADKGIIGKEKYEIMDQLYEIYYPQVLNQHKLDERQQEINNSVYKNGELLLNGNKEAQIGTKLTQLSQMAKQKFNIPYNTPDNDVIEAMSNGIPNGSKLLYDYINNGNPELLYQAGIQDRPQENNIQQGGTKNLINQLSVNNGDKTTWNQIEDITNKTNVIGLGAEKVDQKAGEFADKWLDWGNSLTEGATENLKKKLEGMSQKEVAKYRKQYEKLLKDKDWRVGKVAGDTIVEQLWNGIKGDISYDYSDEDFAKWLVSQKANLGEYLTGADDLLNGESNPNVVQFFGNIPSSALKTFTATVRGMTNPYDTMKGLYKIALTDEGHQAILSRYGSWDAFAKAMNDDPVGVADDIMAVAEIGTNVVRGGMNAAGKITGNQNLINSASKIPQVGSANDALAQKTVGGIYAGMDKLANLSDNSTVNKIAGVVNNTLQTESNLSKMVETGKKGLDVVEQSSVVQAVKNWKDEMVNKIIGIDEGDRQFIRENKELVKDYTSGKKNVETIFDEVKEKISNKQTDNSNMGKEYDNLRQKGQTADTQALASDMVDKLRENKITINADGDLEFDKLSKYNAAQQKALQDAREVVKSAQAAEKLDAGTILDLRQKMDDKINWTGKPTETRNMSSVDKSTEKLIKEMRGAIDERAKTQIDGLKELDEKYAPALEEMRQIKKDWFDADGNFRDNARSKIRNLTKAGNEERLARLEKVAPGITQDLKALDVALTIEKVSKQGVGQYSKSIGVAGTIGALASGNIPALLTSVGVGILATPKNFVKLVEAYPDIVEKLSAGQELLPSDMNRLQALATRIEDGME